MILSFLAFFAQGKPAESPITKLRTYIQGARTLSAELKLSAPGMKGGVGTAKLIYVRSKELYFSVKWADIDYTFVGNERGYWDSEGTTKTYQDADYWVFGYPFSLFSETPELLTPGYLIDGTLQLNRISRLAVLGHATVNGVPVDRIGDAAGANRDEVDVDANGRPVRSVFHRAVPITLDVVSLTVNKPIPGTLFPSSPPSGYHAFSVPLIARPLGIGEKFPMDLRNQTLVMVASPDSVPSERAIASLGRIHASGLGVLALYLAPGGGAALGSGIPTVYDPSGSIAGALNIPGTPFFYLVGAKGVVRKAWYGYDPAQADKFEKDVLASAK